MSTAILPTPTPKGRKREYTPEDLLGMPDGHRYELIDGKLVERNMGAESSEIGANAVSLVKGYARAQKQGKVFGADCGYQMFPQHPKRVRFMDGSFIQRGRLSDEKTPKGHVRIPPDWAVEVVSPNDTAAEVESKRNSLLEAGVRLLWIIYPESRTVHVFRKNGSLSVCTEADQLSGEDVLPGFACRVAELFEDIG